MHFLGILIAALLQQPAPASIEGVVVRAGTSQPIERAKVQLRGTSRSEHLVMATGADGKFEFRNLVPGSYRLTVARSGYLDSAYGQSGQTGAGAALVMEAGQTRKNIRLAMIVSSAISGRVHDSNGEPAVNIPVLAFGYSYVEGQKSLTTVKTDRTDDRGEYRLFGLPPGPYYISSTPGDAGAPVYYPGTADVQGASSVEVRPGADVGGIDFTLARVTSPKVRGTVVDSTTGRPAASAAVALVPRRSSAAASLTIRPSMDGTFEIQNVVPGSYFLVATFWRNVDGRVLAMMGGRMPLEVGGSDVNGVTMIVSPALNVAGEVIVEGHNDTDVDVRNISVRLKNEIQPFPGRATDGFAQFSTGRQFDIINVIEGDYRVQVSDLPKGTYVKSIRYGATNVLNGNFHLDPHAGNHLEIVLSTNAAVLNGTVVDKNRQPVANAPVALVPNAAHRLRGDLYRSEWTDELGRFRMLAIPPGDYSLFAIEGIDETLWRDPEFLARNEAAGKTIRIGSGGDENIELTSH